MSTLNCLKGCINTYNAKGLRKPINREVMMPWVEVWISNYEGSGKPPGGFRIGVSNFSSRNNHAVIESFQFGVSNGQGVLIEIVDEDGGSFTQFFNKISTGNIEAATSKYVLKFQYGWAVSGCGNTDATLAAMLGGIGGGFGGGIGALAGAAAAGPFEQTYGAMPCNPVDNLGSLQTGQMSCVHTMYITNIVCHVVNGVFKYSIEGNDMTMVGFTTRTKKNFGADDSKLPLRLAIETMFKKHSIQVDFLTLTGAGKTDKFQWNKQGDIKSSTDGPNGTWLGMGRNIIEAATDWLNSFVSKRGNGLRAYWADTSDGKPRLVFVESNKPQCLSVANMDAFNVGTYIVNGGSCSPVISFTPTIKYYTFGYYNQTSGVGGGSLASKQFVEVPCVDRTGFSNNEGRLSTQTESDNDYSIFGKQATLLAGQNKLINADANAVHDVFTAEMKIQGDPVYDNPLLCIMSFVSIVFINPFRISGGAGQACEWTSGPAVVGAVGSASSVGAALGAAVNSNTCQPQLSNRNWMITKLFHEIRDGSFTTTLKLLLASPGSDLARSAPLGAMAGAPTLP